MASEAISRMGHVTCGVGCGVRPIPALPNLLYQLMAEPILVAPQRPPASPNGSCEQGPKGSCGTRGTVANESVAQAGIHVTNPNTPASHVGSRPPPVVL